MFRGCEVMVEWIIKPVVPDKVHRDAPPITFQRIVQAIHGEVTLSDGSQFANPAATVRWTKLRVLELQANNIVQMETLNGCVSLEEIDITGNNLSQMPPSEDLRSIKSLLCSNTQLTTLPSLLSMTLLTTLDVSSAKLQVRLFCPDLSLSVCPCPETNLLHFRSYHRALGAASSSSA